jgi:hypothetical protein
VEVAAIQAAQASADAALRANLWAAAEIVAQAAAPTTAMQLEPAAAVPLLPPAPVAAAAPVEALPEAHPAAPALIAAVRPRLDPMNWILFGSSAAFLGVVWLAIYFAAR